MSLILILLWPFLSFSTSNTSIKDINLGELRQKLNTMLAAQGISETDLNQKMRELSKNTPQNQLNPTQLQQSIQSFSESDQQELDSFVRQTLRDHGITQAELNQFKKHIQNTISSLQSH